MFSGMNPIVQPAVVLESSSKRSPICSQLIDHNLRRGRASEDLNDRSQASMQRLTNVL